MWKLVKVNPLAQRMSFNRVQPVETHIASNIIMRLFERVIYKQETPTLATPMTLKGTLKLTVGVAVSMTGVK
jgi:hypothetical protein